MDGSGARPTTSSTEPAACDAGARRRPIANGLGARRGGDVGRDTRPHVQRCQVPSRSNTSDRRRSTRARRPRRATVAPATRSTADTPHGKPPHDSWAMTARLRHADDGPVPLVATDAARRRVDEARPAARPRRTTRSRQAARRGPSAGPSRTSARNGHPSRGPDSSRTRRSAAGRTRHTPRSARVARSTRCSNDAPRSGVTTRAPDDRRLLGDDGRAAAGRRSRERRDRSCLVIDRRAPRPSHGPRRERLRWQVDRRPRRRPPRRAAAGPSACPRRRATPSSRNQAVPQRPARGDAARTRRRVPRRIGRLQQRRPGDAGRHRATRPRPGARAHARISKHLHERPPPAGSIWREEGEAAIVARATYRALIRSARGATVVPSRHQPGCLAAPAHPTRYGREAGVNPAQSRYGDRPSRGGSPVADPAVAARAFERKVRRIVRSTA